MHRRRDRRDRRGRARPGTKLGTTAYPEGIAGLPHRASPKTRGGAPGCSPSAEALPSHSRHSAMPRGSGYARAVKHDDTNPDPTLAAPLGGPAVPFGGERYEILEVIGKGGMGEVRLARDLRIDRRVAMKRMHP